MNEERKPSEIIKHMAERAAEGPSAPAPTKAELTLMRQAAEVDQDEAEAVATVGNMARVLVQATLPHSKPDDNEYSRRNGRLVLHMVAPRARSSRSMLTGPGPRAS